MANYLAMRIIDGAFTYAVVIKRYPQLKDDIDKYLKEHRAAKYIDSSAS